MPRRLRLFQLGLVVLLAGCGGQGAPAASTPRPATRRSDYISRAEIEGRTWEDVYDVVHVLRPSWINDRGRETVNGRQDVVQVHLNGTRYGTLEQLHGLPVSDIVGIRYIDPSTAFTRWG